MGHIITYINEKGGIGKTSCCFNTAWAMSENKRILMVDLDGQRANLSFFAGVEKNDNMATMYDVLHQDMPIENAIVKIRHNLFIVPATSNVSNISQTAKITRLKAELNRIRNDFDYVLIDVNPTPNWTHVLSLSCSDFIIIPMLPDIASLEANKGIAESIEEIVNTTNPNLKVLGILFNKNTNTTNLSKQVKAVADNVAISLGSSVFDTKIRNAIALSENIGLHVGVTEYAPKSPVAGDIQDLVAEIERRVAEIG